MVAPSPIQAAFMLTASINETFFTKPVASRTKTVGGFDIVQQCRFRLVFNACWMRTPKNFETFIAEKYHPVPTEFVDIAAM